MKENLHLFFIVTLIVCSLLASFSSSPVESVLYLIFCFYVTSCVLFVFNVEFLALTYIVVYVGAVAVLFLFIIMMLDIKLKQNFFNRHKFIIYFLLVGFIFLAFLSILVNVDVVFQAINLIQQKYLPDTITNIDVFGQVLYNYNVINFLIAGIVLLIALVGCIFITLDYVKRKNLV